MQKVLKKEYKPEFVPAKKAAAARRVWECIFL